MGADAVVGIDVDYEFLGEGGGILKVTASGTAVKLGYKKAKFFQPELPTYHNSL